LVLEGVFADEHGAYPAGTYVRNPPGTAHTPRVGPEGCTIFVKLWQMQTRGETAVTLDTAADHPAWQPGANAGVSVLPLYRHGEETVRMVRIEPGAVVTPHAHPGGEELLVLEGGFRDEEGHYGAGTWVRSPVGTRHAPVSDEGCLLWIKTGHLAGEIRAPVA
ncbi:MAG: cupin domain-containing protein, partial [Pseudomonadota bacterium]